VRRIAFYLPSRILVAAALAAFGCTGASSSHVDGTGGAPPSGTGGSASSGTGGAPAGGTGGGSSSTGGAPATGTGGTTSTGTGGGAGPAAGVARKLGRASNFLVGMGNDLADDHDNDGAYTLGVTMDLHYAYLVGLPGQGGWPDWNQGGTFVNILSDSAAAHGTTPMYTLYAMATLGDGNLSGLAMDSFMTPYWAGAKLLFQRIAAFGKPALVHLEPDFWAYAQQMAAAAGGPGKVSVRISGLATDCAGLPDDLTGMGRCLLKLARTYAPQAVVGFHASQWAGTPADMVAFLTAVGAADADLIVEDILDRDAGCFEAHVDPNCQRTDGPWYWDETNQTSPNFHDYLTWAKAIGAGLGKPVLWWQVPFGVPSATPGGSAGAYRDNRVHYIFGHLDEFVAAGGLGVVFGTGAGNQTYITSDGNQFQNAVTKYFAAPVALP
jgi:hypothetical protein